MFSAYFQGFLRVRKVNKSLVFLRFGIFKKTKENKDRLVSLVLRVPT